MNRTLKLVLPLCCCIQLGACVEGRSETSKMDFEVGGAMEGRESLRLPVTPRVVRQVPGMADRPAQLVDAATQAGEPVDVELAGMQMVDAIEMASVPLEACSTRNGAGYDACLERNAALRRKSAP